MRSPGQKYKHYSPTIPLELMDSADARLEKYANEKIGILMLMQTCNPCHNVGAGLKPAPTHTFSPMSVLKHWDIRTFETPENYARELYRTMDEMGRNGCTRIIAVLPPDIGIGRAIRNRLIRASGENLV
jgi:L-threonylcarbamoyladenylate synthase